jgi:hypothetical protein
MREIDDTLFSSVVGGVSGELVKLSGGVICSDCVLMIGSRCWTSYMGRDVAFCCLLLMLSSAEIDRLTEKSSPVPNYLVWSVASGFKSRLLPSGNLRLCTGTTLSAM